jgi:hypothetical protein
LLQVLLLAINRYSFSLDRGSSKLHHNLAYPLSLKMKPRWTSDDCPERHSAQYQLIALVTHHGRNASGACWLIRLFLVLVGCSGVTALSGAAHSTSSLRW